MTDAPSKAAINGSGDDLSSNPPTNVCHSEVRIRCIGQTELSNSAPLSSHPVPYSVALADKCATFAASEPTRCEFVEHIPARHNCGKKSIASVASFTRGALRACEFHARASERFGVAVTYDTGYVVAE